MLSRPDDLPLTIVPGVHPGLAGLKVGQVFGQFVQADAEVKKILVNKPDVTTLTTVEKQTIATALGRGGIEVDPNDDTAVRGVL